MEQPPRVYVVPFSHMDLFWLGEREECLSRGNRVIAETIRIAQLDSRFRFLLEDGVFVAHFLACHPERRAELTELVRGGRIEVGPKWVGIYQGLPDGESAIRNLVFGVRQSRELFGTAAPAIHLGDLPGYTPQFPQILAKSGIPAAVLTRCGPRDLPLFRWQGLNGSEVVTWNALDSYAWARNMGLHEGAEAAIEKGLARQAENRLEQTGGLPILVHWGVDLILPTENLVTEMDRFAVITGLACEMATPAVYFATLAEVGDLPVRSGEIPSAWPFSETVNLHTYKHDTTSIGLLLAAEHFTAFADLLGFGVAPQSTLDDAWKLVLQPMDHNNGGQGYDGTALRKPQLHEAAQRIADEALRGALHPIAESVGGFPDPNAQAVVVFNPLGWERTEPVEGHVTFYGNPESFNAENFVEPELVDEQGQPVPYQSWDVREGVSREMRFTFVAEAVPSLGYRTYYFLPKRRATAPVWPVEVGDEHVTAGRYRLSFDRDTATFDLHDTLSGRAIARGIGLVGLVEREDNYYFRVALADGEARLRPTLVGLSLVESGPIRLRWRAALRLADTDFELEFSLYAGLERVDVDVRTEWTQERNLRVLLQLPFAQDDATLRYGVPFGDVVYPEVMPETGPYLRDEMERDQWMRFREVQHWLDVSSPGQGVAVATNTRVVELDSPTVGLVIARSAATRQAVRIVNGQREPIYRMPLGPIHVGASIFPHSGDWATARSYRRGFERHAPLHPIVVADPASPKRLPPSLSFLSVSSDDLVITAFKREGDGRFLLRAYEATGCSVSAELQLLRSPRRVWAANPLGEPLEELHDVPRVAPREIATWLLDL